MWFRNIKKPSPLTEDLVQRVWDCSSRLKQLEDRFDAQLDELSVRYRRAEQSRQRLEEKRTRSPCEDEADLGPETLAGRSLAAYRGINPNANGAVHDSD